ncbi:hypothetical protein Vadar_032342 [Vaccinium darrowii]|uniref:Uncharacterized protein n=1 Tax=Vaccinium darrowii TaxID=229202 RepID=A0ACB7YZY6_9ERIC|nr:hypothetical protein Vadar_032342 [Vaccinium darrowii]
MYDGRDNDLFEHFSYVAQRIGVYTAKDYADVLEFLVGKWNVEALTGLSGEGREAQEYVCGWLQGLDDWREFGLEVGLRKHASCHLAGSLIKK